MTKISTGGLFQQLPCMKCLVLPSFVALRVAGGSNQHLEKSHRLWLPPAARPGHLPALSVPVHLPRRGSYLPSPKPPHRWSTWQGQPGTLLPPALLPAATSWKTTVILEPVATKKHHPQALSPVLQAGVERRWVGASREKAGAESQLACSLQARNISHPQPRVTERCKHNRVSFFRFMQ